MRRRLRVVAALLLALAGGFGTAVVASGHQSGCHSAHSCPSDHHTYIWYDSAGQGWDCVEPGAPEYDSSRDTTVISYAGLTYYCRAAGSQPPPPPPPTTTQPPPTPPPTTNTQPQPPPTVTQAQPTREQVLAAVGPSIAYDANATSGCRLRHHNELPDHDCTPGAIFQNASAGAVCYPGYTGYVRHVTAATKRRVYREYGIRHHAAGHWEVDHLVPLELGGSNDIANLFPEPDRPKPGFRQKDRLENSLHQDVCSGIQDLATAQRGIARNWLRMYRAAF